MLRLYFLINAQKILQIKKCLKSFNHAKTRYTTEAKFQTKPYRLHRLDKGPEPETTLTKSDALKYFELMSTVRKLEANINILYKAKIIRGFCHLYSGQEAVAVGMYAALRPSDAAITSYRCHAWIYLYSKEDPLVAVIAELVGTRAGCSRGKGGSMHMYAPNFYGGNGIVGAQVPLGVGVALAFKYTQKDAVSVVLYGDGAANNGQVFEAFNIAKLWNLPCIFVCENNQYGMGTSTARHSANTEFYTRGDVIPGIWIDGMDILSVREATRFSINHCVSGKGPILLEVYTYRYFGHSLSDPGTSYRTHDEIQKMRHTNDPIKNFSNQLLTANLVTQDELHQIEAKVKKEVDDATERAKIGKEIEMEELTYDIYANDVMKEIRLTTPFRTGPHKVTVNRSQNLK
ncbi:E1 dh and/or TPP enzyme C domain containing protein [Asbolus verrucosus]|uniref:Pyruvate dehydrogenase E1 component subunit alpha n=1 Tax=Asbolus verrucosus TaxID=1661398 RepID=A0A482VW42_ASBVE|nr:E1 dh and/or TPP enzyme C domain containing protein [Asbolus verrucosus]